MDRLISENRSKPTRRLAGGLIDREKRISYRFDGKLYNGYGGDTLASALLAAGVRLVGRSFKYHRPRGILTAGSEEPNALVELRTGPRREANTRATTVELFEGLEARSQNRWPSLSFDVGAINSLFSSILVAGFYYKTFMWPSALWEKVYEPAIRRAAGLGRASLKEDPDSYEKSHAFCDLLVVGGGPAGLAAAVSAARAGAHVILCDEDFMLGGRGNSERTEIDGVSAARWISQVESELASMPHVRIMRRATVFGAYDSDTFGALERVADHYLVPPASQPRQRMWKLVAKRVVIAAGATERPLVFGGNDLPGVMLASSVSTYLNRFAVVAGQRVVVFTASDSGWNTAFDLLTAGVEVEAIVDPRREVSPVLLAHAKRLDARVFVDALVVDAIGARGVRRVAIRDCKNRLVRVSADTLAMSGGWNPNIALSTHLGSRPRWSTSHCAFVPPRELRGTKVVGSANGSFSLAQALKEGNAAGAEVAESLGFKASNWPCPKTSEEATEVTPLWYVGESKGKAFIDFQNDVTRDDVVLAAREGFCSAEHLKRYTTLGMGTDQGRTSNINGQAIMASLTAQPIEQLGTTVFRPPYTPVAIGALAGHHRGKNFRPTRITPSHHWALENGARFTEAGLWLRAQWFATEGENHWLQSAIREVETVRTGVGICDVSTLGKIDIQGRDAGTFLDRVYINMFSNLPLRRVRYGLMLREDGFVFDDGTSARFAEGHYVMSTTTANAARVMQHLEHARQVLWPDLDVQLASVTEQWAQYAIAGPKSRELLTRLLGNEMDLSNTAFPYLACAEFSWRGIRSRIFRISFSGELAYEIAVPARYGDSAIREIMRVGRSLGVVPYGTEALSIMRIEKGHVVGNEINGTTTASDLGFGRMMSMKKDFIGRVLATRQGLSDPLRQVLVGVKPVDSDKVIHAGAHFLQLRAAPTLENDEGYLTSVAYSPTSKSWIGLGLLKNGATRHGESIRLYDPIRSCDVEAKIVPPVFYDVEGLRLRS